MAANPSDSPSHFYSLDEYFALEHASEARYEYWDGEIVCMSGGSLTHTRIATNIIQRLGPKLAGGRCLAFSGDLAIKTPALPPYRYPDVSIVCGEPEVVNIRGVDALVNPVVIVEVLSPSTENRERGEKFAAYKQIATFEEYLLVEQQVPRITHYLRQGDGAWSSKDLTGMGSAVCLRSTGCELSLAEVYEGVAFNSLE